jgi:hypothetical protein
MKTKSSRRTFLQAGLTLPTMGLVIPRLGLEAAAKELAVYPEPSGHPDTGKYGKYVILEPYSKHYQLDDITVTPKQLMADCVITHQVFYEPDVILEKPHAHDFVEIMGLLGTNPMNCREFDAEVEWCLGEEKEKHIIKVPTIISQVKGLMHGPIVITKLNKPIIFLEVFLTHGYSLK